MRKIFTSGATLTTNLLKILLKLATLNRLLCINIEMNQ